MAGTENNKHEEAGEKGARDPGADKQEGQQTPAEQDYRALWDRYLRLQADFDNYRKRSFRERDEIIKFANESLILELLGILDNFERGIKAADQKKDFNLLHQGVDMISKQLHTLLETKGLNRIKSVGERFDPHQHEALEVVDDAGADSDEVVEELQPGYTLNGRVIRPAKVKVRRPEQKTVYEQEQKPADECDEQETDEENEITD